MNMKKQSGFLLLSAVVLIMAVAFIAATAAYVFVINSRSSANQQLTTKAFYVAQAGMQVGLTRVSGTDTTQRLACSAITGNVALTNTAFSPGTFTVTATRYTPVATTISSAVNASVTTIPIVSSTGYASSGIVFIESEAIEYTSIGATVGACGGTAPCLLGAKRGQVGTTAAAHVSGKVVNQDFCQLISTGYVPNQASALATRIIQENVIIPGLHIWSAGDPFSGDLTLTRWMGSTWLSSDTSALTSTQLRAISFYSFTDGWTVGDTTGTADCGTGNTASFYRYNGTNWSRVCGIGLKRNQFGIHCLSANFCMSVGAHTAANVGFFRWNGTSWAAAAFTTSGAGTVDNSTYNDIFCNSPTSCWAVGDSAGNASVPAVVIFWNGTTWSKVTTALPTQKDLYGVWCNSTSDCWIVGQTKTVGRYNGTTWTNMTANVVGGGNIVIRSVTCVSANDCWAVGDRTGGKGSYYRWTGGPNWTLQTGGVVVGVQNKDVYDVICTSSNECYSSGNSTSAAKWNGSTWTDIITGLPNATPMRSLSGVPGGVTTTKTFGWKEVHN